MIKLVIFDAGDILYNTVKAEIIRKVVREFLAKYGVKNFEESERVWLKYGKLARIGKMSWEKVHEKWLEDLGLSKELEGEWREIWRKTWTKYVKKFPYVNETLKILKKSYKLAILSNNIANKEELIEKLEILKIDHKLFDEIFTSHDIGYVKPQGEAYVTVLKYFNVNPEEAVFVGHDKDEIEGAKKVGLVTIVLHDKNAKGDYFANQFKDLPKIISGLIT